MYPRWKKPIDPTKLQDLDDDGQCIYGARLMSSSVALPLGEKVWHAECSGVDSPWTDMTVRVALLSPSSPPVPPSSPAPPQAPPPPSQPPQPPQLPSLLTVLYSFDEPDPAWSTGKPLESNPKARIYTTEVGPMLLWFGWYRSQPHHSQGHPKANSGCEGLRGGQLIHVESTSLLHSSLRGLQTVVDTSLERTGSGHQ
jgi:hypothetical protein